jgi:hypothetical protein
VFVGQGHSFGPKGESMSWPHGGIVELTMVNAGGC